MAALLVAVAKEPETESNKYSNGSHDTMTKYCTNSGYGYNGFTDGKTTLDLSDDAVRVNWGDSWRMHTRAEQDELRDNCTWTLTTKNGIKGYKVTSKTNGNSIFLTAAGSRTGTSGYYWSSSLSEHHVHFVLQFGQCGLAQQPSQRRSHGSRSLPVARVRPKGRAPGDILNSFLYIFPGV